MVWIQYSDRLKNALNTIREINDTDKIYWKNKGLVLSGRNDRCNTDAWTTLATFQGTNQVKETLVTFALFFAVYLLYNNEKSFRENNMEDLKLEQQLQIVALKKEMEQANKEKIIDLTIQLYANFYRQQNLFNAMFIGEYRQAEQEYNEIQQSVQDGFSFYS